ncbi:DUF192 domain-containing protein [Halorubrum sp. SD690R]|uniref:DUF192 domain-containing protein n=1 Tax=Halorubrum sp. SD690R TaxID=2518117 RepID=UPI0010F7CCA1|nr:DUF192 domain-containing protein [Halorubrum sp. SD690R]TKX47232.1 DUF192 domain-containing protein [Halorubrum sp. SD690R]
MSSDANASRFSRASLKTVDRRQFLTSVTVGISGIAGCSTRDVMSGRSEETPEGFGSPDATIHSGYASTDIVVRSPDDDKRGEVTAAIADTTELRYLGLSDTEMLPADRGMLFVFESERDLSFVMREMSFGIDILYLDADRTITEIHHASEPGPNEDGSEQSYPGWGQYVLEVNYDWTTDRAVAAGDVVTFDL